MNIIYEHFGRLYEQHQVALARLGELVRLFAALKSGEASLDHIHVRPDGQWRFVTTEESVADPAPEVSE